MPTSLYRRYRPASFSDVVGQKHIVSTLSNALEQTRISHAYLFCGPRGTGKTTMARLLAKALLSGSLDNKPRADFDPNTETSRAIAAGTHPDVYELDAASRTGVDSVREEIITKVSFAPTQGAYKVYIIDEVHMLTTAAFNALLKTLEEPPAHIVFVLCTTDPQKVPDTILSRCQRFDFTHFSIDDLQKRLEYVCQQEGFDYDEEALHLIAQHSLGGMRDALSSLEQLSVFGAGKISLADAQELLGELSSDELFETARILASRNLPQAFEQIARYNSEGMDFQRLMADLAGYLRNVYVYQVLGAGAFGDPTKLSDNPADAQSAQGALLHINKEDLKSFEELGSLFEGPDRVHYILACLAELLSQLRTAADQRLCVELMFARLSRPDSDVSLEALAERLERLERRASFEYQAGQGTGSSQSPVPSARPQAAATPGPQQPVATRPSAPALQSNTEPKQSSVYASENSVDLEKLDTASILRNWDKAKSMIMQRKPARGVLLQKSQVRVDDAGILCIELPGDNLFTFDILQQADNVQLVKDALAEVFGAPVGFRYCAGFACGRTQVPAQKPQIQPHQQAPRPVEASQPQAQSAKPTTRPAPSPQVLSPVDELSEGKLAALSDAQKARLGISDLKIPEGEELKKYEGTGLSPKTIALLNKSFGDNWNVKPEGVSDEGS